MDLNEYLIDDRNKKNNGTFSEMIQRVKRSSTYLKLKENKKLSLLVLVGIILVIALVTLQTSTGVESVVSSSTDISDTEIELTEVLSKISGVGNVKVMISYEGGMKKVIAYDTTVSSDITSADGRENEYVSENRSPVTVNVSGTYSPLVLQELKPEITGVIVVAEGAGNLRVRLDLLSAVKTVLNISGEKVEVFTMNN